MADPAAPEPIVRAAQPGDALCLSVLAMHVFLDTCATQGVRPALAREARACYFGDALRQLRPTPARGSAWPNRAAI